MILIVSDVLMDVALDRRPHAEIASSLLGQLELGTEQAFVAWHTVSNVFYNVGKQRSRVEARRFIVDLLDLCSVASTGDDDIRYALSLPMRDFEDAMQVAAAASCHAQYIVTRNKRDFRTSPIPAIPPSEALALLR